MAKQLSTIKIAPEAIYDYVNRHEGVLHWNGEQIYDWYQPIADANMKAAK